MWRMDEEEGLILPIAWIPPVPSSKHMKEQNMPVASPCALAANSQKGELE